MFLSVLLLQVFNPDVDENVASVFLSSRLRKGQMKEASEMKYGDKVEGVY